MSRYIRYARNNIPSDYEVQPLKPGESAEDRCTCATCGLSWDDAIPTGITPTPSGRCPFEPFHADMEYEEQTINRKHTSGPWEVCHGQMGSTWVKSRHSLIATIPTDSVFCAPEVEQNARLIAAAPALLDALKAILPVAEQALEISVACTTRENDVKAVLIARAALMIANGEGRCKA